MTSIPDGIRALVVALLQMGGDELRDGQPGARITISSLNTGTDAPWEDCYSVNVDAEVLARVIKALGGPAGVSPVRGAVAQPAQALSDDERDLFDQLDDLYTNVDLDDLTKTVLNDTKPSDRLTVTQAIDGMFGHIPHRDVEDGDVL